MDRREFSHQLQDALAHLYDYPYLESHPLVAVLLPTGGRRAAGALSQALSSAIEMLRPAPGLQPDSRPWREYHYLILRYVRLHSVTQIAHELGVSERQSQRIHAEALESLASALWARASVGEETERQMAVKVETGDAQTTTLALSVDDSELARLAVAPTEKGVSFAEVVGSVVATVERLAGAKNASVVVALPATLPPVAVQRTLVRQGLLSLVVAALHCADHLEISASTSDGAVLARVLVGEPPGASSSASGSFSGTLLQRLREDGSLAQARHLLRVQGGAVEIAESAGGAAILVSLPVVQPKTVLIVDDNPDTIRLLSRYLAGGTYRVVEALSGKRALQLARQVRPAAITLDVMMPNQDGWETLQSLRTDPETRDIPVIICSVIDQPDLALSLGATDVLTKPVGRPALLHALKRCLGGTEQGMRDYTRLRND